MSQSTQHRSFWRYGSHWRPISVVTETSDSGIYQWLKVTAVWTGFGPMPLCAEPCTFFYRKCQVKDFAGNPLATPRYI